MKGGEEIGERCAILVYVSVAGTRLIATMETAFEARSGDTACIAINPNKVHLFSPETSKRLD